MSKLNKAIRIRVYLLAAIFPFFNFAFSQNSDLTGFFIWEETTYPAVLEEAIANGVHSFRSRDLTVLQKQSAWNIFSNHANEMDVMVGIPLTYLGTTTLVNLNDLAKIINNNKFIRRLHVYPELQPGMLNPSELDPCKDWLTGYADQFETRIRLLDSLIKDRSVEIIVSGQLATAGCADLTQILNTLYDLQRNGRNVAWGVTVYPYYYGNQDTSLSTLSKDIDEVLTSFTRFVPAGASTLPLRVIETGWPSQCSVKATQKNQCGFTNSAFSYSKSGVKLYVLELQDNNDGWTECEKHFGLWDIYGEKKCSSPLAITENSNFNVDLFKVYPNPTEHTITITPQNGVQGTDLFIYNVFGQILMRRSLTKEESVIDISQFPDGIYVIKIATKKDFFVTRVMKN